MERRLPCAVRAKTGTMHGVLACKLHPEMGCAQAPSAATCLTGRWCAKLGEKLCAGCTRPVPAGWACTCGQHTHTYSFALPTQARAWQSCVIIGRQHRLWCFCGTGRIIHPGKCG